MTMHLRIRSHRRLILAAIVLIVLIEQVGAYRSAGHGGNADLNPSKLGAGYSTYTRSDAPRSSQLKLESARTRGPPGRQGNDNILLNQAVDAFRQASELEKELKRSEESVSAQTKELRTELAKAKATAQSTGQSKYFKREERLDEALMKQAEIETRRDKKLVAQAEKEMEGDKQFLESAYHVKDINGVLALSSPSTCPEHRCHQAKASGLAPSSCTVAYGSCPQIRCYAYQPSGTCDSGTICMKPAQPLSGCKSRAKTRWVKKHCPAMSCSLAKMLFLQPDFCAITPTDGVCPQLSCYHYTDLGSCQQPTGTQAGGPPGLTTQGTVCMKPDQADAMCLSDKRARGGADGGGRRTSSILAYADCAVNQLEMTDGKGQTKMSWTGPGRTAMIVILVILSCIAGVAFAVFRRYGASLAAAKKPPPVPAYYGRL